VIMPIPAAGAQPPRRPMDPVWQVITAQTVGT
jgi:hypothetical protein